jgi:hypothetical protein
MKTVWLRKQVSLNERGHFEFFGDCWKDHILVEVDCSITRDIPGDKQAAILRMHGRIQEVARRMYKEGRAFPAYRTRSGHRRVYHHIAITDLDLVEG